MNFNLQFCCFICEKIQQCLTSLGNIYFCAKKEKFVAPTQEYVEGVPVTHSTSVILFRSGGVQDVETNPNTNEIPVIVFQVDPV